MILSTCPSGPMSSLDDSKPSYHRHESVCGKWYSLHTIPIVHLSFASILVGIDTYRAPGVISVWVVFMSQHICYEVRATCCA
jgi:hypothetical protein